MVFFGTYHKNMVLCSTFLFRIIINYYYFVNKVCSSKQSLYICSYQLTKNKNYERHN